MNTNQTITNERASLHGNAVVIGSGIAGLSAARVLADYFDKVIVIDRDHLPASPDFRAGVPQAHHAHTLLPYGQMLLERQFPGLIESLLDNGAVTIEDKDEVSCFDEDGTWHPVPMDAEGGVRRSRTSIASSRPLLETIIYQQVSSHPRIEAWQGYQVLRLEVNEDRSAVTGVALRSMGLPAREPLILNAALVIDASGRNSRAPEWLKSLGYEPPAEWQIDSHAGYASRLYKRPTGFNENWKKLYISPSPPDGTRGGIITPLEGDRWHVTLIGLNGDYPPINEEGFLEFARSLPASDLYDAIVQAEPVGRISGYRRNANRVRRYESLPRYLEGFVVLGDAAFTMNPVYALGMTAAAVGGKALNEVLRECSLSGSITGLAEAFQKHLAREMMRLWRQAVQKEWRWPLTDISDNLEEIEEQVPAAL